VRSLVELKINKKNYHYHFAPMQGFEVLK
jgi:hypothetical protein